MKTKKVLFQNSSINSGKKINATRELMTEEDTNLFRIRKLEDTTHEIDEKNTELKKTAFIIRSGDRYQYIEGN